MPRTAPYLLPAALFVLIPICARSLPAQDFSHDSAQPAAQAPLIQQANDALANGDYTGALKLLSAVNGQLPNNPQVLYDIGLALDALSDAASSAASSPSAANGAATAASSDPAASSSSSNGAPPPTTAEAAYRAAIAADANFAPPHVALGLLLARNGHSADARAEFDAALALTNIAAPLKARALRARARLELSGDLAHSLPPDPTAASADLLAALKLVPEQPEDILLSAQIAEATPDLPAAERAYRRYLALPGNAAEPAATAALAHLLLIQRHPADAEALLDPAHAAHPDNPAFTAQLAQAWIDSGDPSKIARAVPLVESLHTANPSNAAVTRLLARVYVATGQQEKADPLYAGLIARDPKPSDPTLATDYADLLIRQHRPAEAEKLLKQALANPHSYATPADEADAALHLAFAAQDIDDPKTTLQALALSATLQPPSPPALFLEATANDALHQSSQAVENYKKFLAASAGKYPDQESQARQRLAALQHAK
ncbi:MAG TPA: tetratricopeptide repeat protein [Acidobacteriaceae bacterium]|nr:tetratricopeptide repeat protein [Acidobacteriaceae bacterium]